MLRDGDFEIDPVREQTGWIVQQVPTLDQVDISVRRVAQEPHLGKQCLMMKITPKNKLRPISALERTYVALHSPAVKLPPGTLVRISAFIRMPGGTTASPDGALFFDSAGGEPLAVRVTEPLTMWKKFQLYREVPASGMINVTLAMSGLGTVYFDDVRIEPLEAARAARASALTPLPVQPRQR